MGFYLRSLLVPRGFVDRRSPISPVKIFVG